MDVLLRARSKHCATADSFHANFCMPHNTAITPGRSLMSTERLTQFESRIEAFERATGQQLPRAMPCIQLSGRLVEKPPHACTVLELFEAPDAFDWQIAELANKRKALQKFSRTELPRRTRLPKSEFDPDSIVFVDDFIV